MSPAAPFRRSEITITDGNIKSVGDQKQANNSAVYVSPCILSYTKRRKYKFLL